MKNKFPILGSNPKEYIPLNIVKLHEKQAIRNHGQTLERLAERGGLSWIEVLFVLKDESYNYRTKYTEITARIDVMQIVEFHTKNSDDISKEINVPLTWEEIDQVVIALRLTNKAFKGDMRDELEEKMSNYSTMVKLL